MSNDAEGILTSAAGLREGAVGKFTVDMQAHNILKFKGYAP